jgi:hypothetical protein
MPAPIEYSSSQKQITYRCYLPVLAGLGVCSLNRTRLSPQALQDRLLFHPRQSDSINQALLDMLYDAAQMNQAP